MKRERNHSEDQAQRRVYRKQSLDQQPRTGDTQMQFDFDEEDIRRFRKQNLEDEVPERPARADGRRVYHRQEMDRYEDPGVQGGRRRRRRDDPAYASLAAKRQTNKEIRRMAYVMLALMFGVILYFTWFNLTGSRNVVNNPNNNLLGKIAQKIERGNILSADGQILARNVSDGNGSSYREYPFGNVYAHVVGTSQINKSGVEQTADYDLVSSDIQPIQKILNDIRGIKSPGNDVVTTLDSQLQQTASQQLGYQDGAIIAIEPSTGKILAMVSKPDYDPNTLSDYYQSILADSQSKVLLNQATQGVFVPGSIFKVVTTLAYLRSGLDAKDYSYDCSGSISLATDEGGEQSIGCYGGEAHGSLDLTSSFAKSCNSSYAQIGQMVSRAKMNDVCKSLLFNSSLPTSLPTAKSIFSLKDGDSAWTAGATAIGQGSTQMSPIHAAMITCAIANQGKLMKPYVVDSVRNADGKQIRETKPEEYGELMTSKEASRLQEMMEAVVARGTGYALLGKNYTSAGKTGTAEVSGRGNNAWFIGYAPAENPKIAVCVLVENSGTGSSVAVPIAGALFDTYLAGGH